MKTRIKKKAGEPINRDRAELLVSYIAENQNKLVSVSAAYDAEILRIQQDRELHLKPLIAAIAEQSEQVQRWAEANPQEFTPRKSIQFPAGTVGFRTGVPKLKTIARWKWDAVLDALRGITWGRAYIRVKEEIDKEVIIADFGSGILCEKEMRKVGTEVVQEESFYIEPNLTEVETRQVAKAEAA